MENMEGMVQLKNLAESSGALDNPLFQDAVSDLVACIYFFGIRQSGDLNFRIADIYKHADMLRLAQDLSLIIDDI